MLFEVQSQVDEDDTLDATRMRVGQSALLQHVRLRVEGHLSALLLCNGDFNQQELIHQDRHKELQDKRVQKCSSNTGGHNL